MYTQMEGLEGFSLKKAVKKVVNAPLKVATKVASKVLPDKLEKVALAPIKLATRVTDKTTQAVLKPISKAAKNPQLLQAAGAIATAIPGGQPAGAALMSAGTLARVRQQRQADKAIAQAQSVPMSAPQVQSSAPAPYSPDEKPAAPAPAGNQNMPYIIGGVALIAFLILTQAPIRRKE